METQTPKLYSKKHLLDALKAADLHCTYPTLLKYEKINVLKKPVGMIIFDDREWRLYNKQEVDDAILAVHRYRNPKYYEMLALKAKAEQTANILMKELKPIVNKL
jgi:hypothetical protein